MARTFTVQSRLRSITLALRGIGLMLRTQHNAWIHAIATAGVAAVGIVVGLSAVEWCLLIVVTIGVWTAEALNTALELLADVASPELHPLVEQAKDVAAGGVLIAAMGAAIVGVLILGPPILEAVAEWMR